MTNDDKPFQNLQLICNYNINMNGVDKCEYDTSFRVENLCRERVKSG